jgi:hypothetical protein
MALPFQGPSGRGDGWFSVGSASSFPNITKSTIVTLSEPQLCGDHDAPKQGCKVFLAPNTDDGLREAIQIPDDPKDQVNVSLRRGEQVLVFQYQGKFHALDNVCSIAAPGRRSPMENVLTLTEMSSFIIPALERHPVRHRGFWRRPERRYYLSQAWMVI